MNTYLLSWNPEKSNYKDFDSETAALEQGEDVRTDWSVTQNTRPQKGDRFFLIKLGDVGRGIFASGSIESTPEEKLHYNQELAKEGKKLNFVEIKFERLLEGGRRPIISTGELKQLNEKSGVKQHWYAENSGIQIRETIVPYLERLWEQKTDIQSAPTEMEYLLAAEELDKRRETLQRTEQRFLRAQLFGNGRYSSCCICGEMMPIDFLVAAHVKKRSKCSVDEKLDFKNNVVPMCRFGCDELFERGYISVDKGKVVDLSVGATLEKAKNYISGLNGKKCLAYEGESNQYFDWHYDENSSNE